MSVFIRKADEMNLTWDRFLYGILGAALCAEYGLGKGLNFIILTSMAGFMVFFFWGSFCAKVLARIFPLDPTWRQLSYEKKIDN